MDKRIIDLWADIGSEKYWNDLPVYKGRNRVSVSFEEIYVPFNNRWPQPGFIGKRYFRLPKRKRIVVMAQNSRASASGNPTFRAKDDEMFGLIRKHSKIRSQKSLDRLFKMIREFMLLSGSWPPFKEVQQYIGLDLDDIAYMNLIPLATHGDRITTLTLEEAYKRSTKLQLNLLKPSKIIVVGKTAYDNFIKWGGSQYDVRYMYQTRFFNSLTPKQKQEYRDSLNEMKNVWIKS